MRLTGKILVMMAAMCLPLLLNAQQQNDKGNQIQETFKQTDTLRFTVYGMDCPGCEGSLEKQVNKIGSVKYCKADWVEQELKIVLRQDSALRIPELEKRVKKANFTLATDAAKDQNQK
jgi:copper chaperone CopZ